jgi:hypothetical protein
VAMDRRNKKHRGSPQPGAVLKIWGECPNGIGEKKVHKPITSFLSQGCEPFSSTFVPGGPNP